MSTQIFQDHGIRFQYPVDWELDVSEDPPRTTVSIQSPGGLAFALVTVDEDRPAPADLADEALAALRDEYPQLDASPALETLAGHRAVGHDVEFISLDMTNSSSIRAFRTPTRTVFLLAQWSELEGDDVEAALQALRRSLEETAD
jgi:hypothetical protein